jgi:hypothetical protein
MQVERSWNWKDKLRVKLFPPEHCPLPEAPPTHQDVIHMNCYGELSILDRLRILITGRVKVEAKIVCQNIVGDTVPLTKINPLPPKWADPDYRQLHVVKG